MVLTISCPFFQCHWQCQWQNVNALLKFNQFSSWPNENTSYTSIPLGYCPVAWGLPKKNASGNQNLFLVVIAKDFSAFNIMDWFLQINFGEKPPFFFLSLKLSSCDSLLSSSFKSKCKYTAKTHMQSLMMCCFNLVLGQYGNKKCECYMYIRVLWNCKNNIFTGI